MNPNPDFIKAMTGQLPFILILASLTSFPCSWGLLALYRRAALRSMNQRAPALPLPPVLGSQTGDPPLLGIGGTGIPLELAEVRNDPHSGPGVEWVRKSWREWFAVTVAAGVAYAVMLSIPWLILAQANDRFRLGRALWLVTVHLWPLMLALLLDRGHPRGFRRKIAGGYAALVVVLVGWLALRGPDETALRIFGTWVLFNGPCTLLYLGFGSRQVRMVGPLVAFFLGAGALGVELLLGVMGKREDWLRVLVQAGGQVGLGAKPLFVATILVGFLGLGVPAGWAFLAWIGRRYLRKRTSDQWIIQDALWLFFAIGQSLEFAFDGAWYCLFGPLGFLAYFLITRLGFAWCRARRPIPGDAPLLLLLRVFALGKRSERMYDDLSQRWLRWGPISMIAGPDLVTRTIDPPEFLAFLGGRLSREFVSDASVLDRRLLSLDDQPGPDRRHRCTEFFCHADTWREAMRRLAGKARVILMDLRSFGRGRSGCQYELAQLLFVVPLERVLIVVDETTDRTFLDECLTRLWKELPSTSPNRGLSPARLRLLVVQKGSVRDPERVFRALARIVNLGSVPHFEKW